jgi:type IV pilus assembly protein PilE
MCPEPAPGERPPRRARAGGFTLIEMMIVVACVAILATVALPSYQSSIRKARRTDAKTALTTVSQLMERYSTEHGSYLGATLGNGTTDLYKAVSESGYYTLSLPANKLTINGFTVQAVATGGQAADACTSYTLDQSGTRGSQPGAVSTCW